MRLDSVATSTRVVPMSPVCGAMGMRGPTVARRAGGKMAVPLNLVLNEKLKLGGLVGREGVLERRCGGA